MKQSKRTLLIDLDGVLNKYTGSYDKDYIPEPKEGTHDFLEKLSQSFELRLNIYKKNTFA